MTQLRLLACAVVATVGLFALVLTRAPVEVEHAVGGGTYRRHQLKEVQRLQGVVEHLTARLRSVEKDALDAKAAAPPMRGGDARSTRAVTQPTLEPAGSFASPVEPVREGDGLERCTVADVPILRLLHKPCPDGKHGFDCKARWDLLDKFLPDPDRWLREWRAARHAVLDCPRAFFATFAQRLDDAHFEAEWDAQPFRIVPAPPRTIGKMLHQLVTANYYHLTRAGRHPTRRAPLPGENYLRAGTPGFRWNVLDTGAQDNVLWRALRNGRRCTDERVAWHCLWERFPTRRRWDAAVSDGSALGIAADQLYNTSLAGEHPRGMVQYLVAAGVAAVFTRPAPALDRYLRDHLRVICHKPGPYCGRAGGEGSGPVAAVHVRHGDSCDRHRDQPGPFNAMFAPDPKKARAAVPASPCAPLPACQCPPSPAVQRVTALPPPSPARSIGSASATATRGACTGRRCSSCRKATG